MIHRFHKPVMSNQILEYLNLQPNKTILDCTIGTGGHAELILKRISPEGKLIGIDRDAESLMVAKGKLKDFDENLILIQEDFRNFDRVLTYLNIDKVDGMLFDLGLSSYQLLTPERGFSIRLDGPLDMRMDRKSYISAYDLVNNLTENEISKILKTFGEEHWHNRIARFLVKERVRGPIATTTELSNLVLRAVPYKGRHYKIHPATRTFQAFRIAVNRELEALSEALEKSVNFLSKGAKICVISFHSLEDRIVKEKFRQFFKSGILIPVITRPLRPSYEEIKENPRCRSAKLRVAERPK